MTAVSGNWKPFFQILFALVSWFWLDKWLRKTYSLSNDLIKFAMLLALPKAITPSSSESVNSVNLTPHLCSPELCHSWPPHLCPGVLIPATYLETTQQQQTFLDLEMNSASILYLMPDSLPCCIYILQSIHSLAVCHLFLPVILTFPRGRQPSMHW